MARVIKINLGKYANPKLAQSAKAAVLASMVEYLNGEEFERIVTAPLNYNSPDFVSSTEAELGTMGVNFSPTNARQRYSRVWRCICLIRWSGHKRRSLVGLSLPPPGRTAKADRPECLLCTATVSSA